MRHFLPNTAADILAWWRRTSTVRNTQSFHARSIVAVETTRLGDVIAILPVLSSARRHFPSATIGVVVREECASIFDMFPAVDAVISVAKSIGLSQFFQLRRQLRQINPDLMLSMSPSHVNALVTLGTVPGAKAGYFRSYHRSTPFLFDAEVRTIGIPNSHPGNARMLNVYRRAALVAESTGIPCDAGPEWQIPPDVDSATGEILSARGFDPATKLVIIHPFARWHFREWPLQRYVDVAREIVARTSSFVLFTGNSLVPEDTRNLRGAIQHEERMAVVDAHNLTTLPGTLARARLFIGNDSGPLHLAASLGVPTLGLYGPAPPSLTAPITPLHESIYVPLECSPCGQQTCGLPGKSCMPRITVTQVINRAISLLLRVDQPVTA